MLISCSQPIDYRIIIDRSTRGGGLYEISGSEVYQKTIENEQNLVLLLGIDFCSSCQEAKTQCDAYGKLKNLDIFYVNLTDIDETEYGSLYDATRYIDETYSLPEYGELFSVPKCYIFSQQAIIITFSHDYVSKLDTYIKVGE